MKRKITFLFLLALAMLSYQTIVAQTRAAAVTGHCFLEGQTDHSGVKVRFEAVSPSAVTTEVFTAIDGAFTAGLAEGIYNVEYTKATYFPKFKYGTFFENTALPDVTLHPGFMGTMEVSGSQSGVWESGYLIKVVGEISVAANDTLWIQPGVQVWFMGNYALTVNGTLLAAGTVSDSIVFTSGKPSPAKGDWQYLYFKNSTSSGSMISFTKIEYGQNGIYCYNSSSPNIQNNSISNNSSTGIYCESSSPTIQNNSISNNSSYGISCSYSSPTIQNNNINNSYSGIYCTYSSSNIQNNNISNNSSYGIFCISSSPNIQNNSISNNSSCGICCISSCSPTIQNNILSQNVTGIYSEYYSHPSIFNNIFIGNSYGLQLDGLPQSLSYNLFWQNTTLYLGTNVPPALGQIVTQNTNGDPCDTYWNLFMDPQFVDYANGDYHLTENSPCLDAGNPAPAYYDPDGTIADIGEFYYNQGSAVPPVINDFTGTPLTGAAPLVVQFSQNITGPVTAYNWFFGDGSTSNLPNPVHVFIQPGTFYVALEVTGPGGSNTKFKPNYIHVQTPVIPLHAAFTGAPLLGSVPLVVQFTNQSTGPWLNLLWDFGDGNTSAETNPLHTYEIAGNYGVSLTAFSTSNQDTELKNNYIQVVALQQVVAIFTTTGTNGAAPFSAGFFNQSFGSVDSLSWDFGDGASSTLANPIHTYQLPGEYLATLTVHGPLNTSIASETIVVASKAPIITNISDRPGDQGGYVYIQFKKSFYDNVVPGKSNESYTVQRQDNGHWVSLNSMLAYGEAVYTVETTTIYDSTVSSNGISNFRIIAGMDEGTWISEAAQGYSVDNLAPDVPVVLNCQVADNELAFSWNLSAAHDFDHFAIYKSNQSGNFAGAPYTTLTTTSFTDAISPDEAWFYSVTAFDYAGNQSAYSEEVSTLRNMNITLPQGWSGISGYLNVYDPSVESIFAPMSSKLIILQSETGMYWPGQNINTIGTWQTGEGYKIKLSESSDFTLRGTRIADRSLELSSGWNLMPVLSENNTGLPGLFGSTSLIMAKEVAGWRIYWPDYGINSLEYLEPGKAYFALMASNATIVFPTEASKNSLINEADFPNISPWNQPFNTPSTHVVAFAETAKTALEPGDFIGAFTNAGLCAGIARYGNNGLALVAFGDDNFTASTDGFAVGEQLTFKLFRPSTGESYHLDVTWKPAMNTGSFIENGISEVSSVKLSPTGIHEAAGNNISIFPNPTKGLFTIEGIDGAASVKICNAFGIEITTVKPVLSGIVDLSEQPKGVYFIRIETGGRVDFEKVVVN